MADALERGLNGRLGWVQQQAQQNVSQKPDCIVDNRIIAISKPQQCYVAAQQRVVVSQEEETRRVTRLCLNLCHRKQTSENLSKFTYLILFPCLPSLT